MNMNDIKVDFPRLESYGFVRCGSSYVYEKELSVGQLLMRVEVSEEGDITSGVTDDSGEEYVLHLVDTAVGAFVGKVREEYGQVMDDIIKHCCHRDVYKQSQTNEVIAALCSRYGTVPEFPWDDENSIMRRSDNGKWYAVFLKVGGEKIGLDDDIVEITNFKMRPEDVERLVDGKRYFPAYHMNKKHWVTVCLDGRVPTEEILEKIIATYNLVKR